MVFLPRMADTSMPSSWLSPPDTGIHGPRLAVIGRATRPLPERHILGRGCADDWHHWGRSPTYAAPPSVHTTDCSCQVVASQSVRRSSTSLLSRRTVRKKKNEWKNSLEDGIGKARAPP